MDQNTLSSDTGNGLIHILPQDVANKIAAGEVIQRPSSVVKELLDNALDSGASHISVIIQNAGRTLIQVVDNGCGIAHDDIPLSFQNHATSKIRRIDDLFSIRTLGFRGEALASIASVGQVLMKTKTKGDDIGYEYEISGGEEVRFEPAASEAGTTIAVRNLFFNVPARRSFLKTDATEFRHILMTVQQAALANHDVAFDLLADTDEIYRLPAQSLDERIVEIFGRSYKQSLIPVDEQTSYVSIHGYLSDPKLAKKNRGEQFFFVNGRPIQHRHLTHVVLNTYHQWIRDNEYPFFAIYFQIDPAEVDVNVHPGKIEVKFGDERSLSALTRSVVRKALNERYHVPIIDREGGEYAWHSESSGFNSGFGFGGGATPDRSFNPLRIPSRINFDRTQVPAGMAGRLYGDPEAVPGMTGKAVDRPDETPGYDKRQGFWQLHDSYIISQTLTGLCIVDQHAAHMRIIYEKALQAMESGLPATQQLLFPQTIEFSATEYSLLKELLPTIRKMGFNIQLLSGNSAMLSGVPADIKIGDENNLLRSMLEQYQNLSPKIKMKEREKLAMVLASRTAVPKGRKLTNPEMEGLIDQLFACEDPYFDPLRKPTIIYIPLEDIASRFR